MIRRQIHRLPGMRDATARGYDRSRQAAETLRAYFGQKGYGVIDTPLLEETELFVRKSGGELTNRLYTFTDPGGRKVSLRPEFTSSVIRHFIQERESLTTPIRWQYCGPVFRYEQGDRGVYRQFTQVGAELVGAAGVEADAEVICLALEGLQEVGVDRCALRVGHLGVLQELLNGFGLSEPAKLFIIGNVQALKSGRTDAATLKARAEDVGMLRPRSGGAAASALAQAGREEGQEYIEGVLKESMPAPVGRRTTEEIVARLLRKVRDADDPNAFERAAALVGRLARLEGSPAKTLREARRIASAQALPTGPFDQLARLCESLARGETAQAALTLDLGLARGISYYTGVIFELMGSSVAGGPSLGGGGRYDGLVKALGDDEDVPALGFAYNLDQVADLLEGVPSAHSEASVSP